MSLLVAGYLLLVLVVVPVMSRRTAASGLLATLPRPVLYRTSMATAWGLTVIGAAVLALSRTLSLADVRLTLLSPGAFFAHLGITLVATLAVGLMIAWLRKALRRPESRDVFHLIPRTARERRLFWGVSATAGLTEEFVFRGIALAALADAMPTGAAWGPWVAVGIVSVAFGFGHGYQDALGMLRAGALGFILAVPAILTGSLLPGIVAHFLIDLSLVTPLGRMVVGATSSHAPLHTGPSQDLVS